MTIPTLLLTPTQFLRQAFNHSFGEEWQKAIGNRELADNRNTFFVHLNSRAFFTCAEKIGVDFKTVIHLASSIDYRDVSFQFVPEKVACSAYKKSPECSTDS